MSQFGKGKSIVTEIVMGIIGLFVLICAVFDVDWFINLTRARRNISMGRTFTRILMGLVGLGFVINGIASL